MSPTDEAWRALEQRAGALAQRAGSTWEDARWESLLRTQAADFYQRAAEAAPLSERARLYALEAEAHYRLAALADQLGHEANARRTAAEEEQRKTQ